MYCIDDLMSIYKESWECYGIAQRRFTQKSLISHVQFQVLTVVVIKVIGSNLCQYLCKLMSFISFKICTQQ